MATKKEQLTATQWTDATPWHPVLFVEAPGSHLHSRLASQTLLISGVEMRIQKACRWGEIVQHEDTPGFGLIEQPQSSALS